MAIALSVFTQDELESIKEYMDPTYQLSREGTQLAKMGSEQLAGIKKTVIKATKFQMQEQAQVYKSWPDETLMMEKYLQDIERQERQ